MPFKKIIGLFLYCLFFLNCGLGTAVASVCDSSVEIRCISVGVNGNVSIAWDTAAGFVNFHMHYIYTSTSKNGPYFLRDSILNRNTTTYTDLTSNAKNGPIYYYIESSCGAGNGNMPARDTVCTMFLTVVNQNNGLAELSWNAVHTPPLSSSMGWYRVFREYPAGVWTFIDSTKKLSFNDTITICSAVLNYMIETGDYSGCTSVSSIAGGIFEIKIGPATPVLDTVSVNGAGNAVLGWQPSSSHDTKGYVVYRYNSKTSAWVPIDTVLGINSTFFTDLTANPNAVAVSYCIAAFDSCNNISPQGAPHNTIFIKTAPNACARYINISWNSYHNIPSSVKGYDIYLSINGGSFIYQTTNDSTNLTFLLSNLVQGAKYCFLIEARNNSGTMSSSSDTISYTEKAPPEPTFSYLGTATVPSNNLVIVKSHVDVAAEIKKYNVLRSESLAGPFQLLGSIPFPVSLNPDVFFTDSTAQTSEMSYYYKTVAVDTCNNDTTQTNIGRTILLLAAANSDLTNTLTWNDYEFWPDTALTLTLTQSFNIYRSVDGVWGAGPIAIVKSSGLVGGNYSYVDPVAGFYTGQGLFAYYIVAQEGPGNPYGAVDSSRSNVAEALQNANVYIPNAFVPDGVNKIFIPVFSFLVKDSYDFTVFDRWGSVVFETTDTTLGWDGTISGLKGDEAVYVYLLKYMTAYGEVVTRKGMVALLR
jgi:hypothetical protein